MQSVIFQSSCRTPISEASGLTRAIAFRLDRDLIATRPPQPSLEHSEASSDGPDASTALHQPAHCPRRLRGGKSMTRVSRLSSASHHSHTLAPHPTHPLDPSSTLLALPSLDHVAFVLHHHRRRLAPAAVAQRPARRAHPRLHHRLSQVSIPCVDRPFARRLTLPGWRWRRARLLYHMLSTMPPCCTRPA